MLKFFRNQSDSKIVKFFLALLMLTFVLWGFGSFLSGIRKGNVVAIVGTEKITEEEWYKSLNQNVHLRERIFGRKMTKEEINDPEFRVSVLRMLINNALLKQEADSLKLRVSDEVAAKSIMDNPFFKNENGSVDREKLEHFLKYQNLNERQFFEIVKDDISSNFLLDAVKNSDVDIDIMQELLTKAYHSKHTLDIYKVATDSVVLNDEPSTEELKEIYKRDSSFYTIPEKRKVLYIVFAEDDVDINEEISETDVREYYDENSDMFMHGELRMLYHIVFDSLDDAANASSSLQDFDSFKDLAHNMGISVEGEDFSLGLKSKDELLPEIAEHVFETSFEGLVEQPLKTPLGWHLFFVAKIVPESHLGFDEVYDDIVTDIIEKRKERELNVIAQQIDADLVSGLSLHDIAGNYGLKVKARLFTYDNDRFNDTFGDSIAESIKEKAKEMIPDETFGVEYESSSEQYYVMRLQDVEPQHLQGFDKVENSVVKSWESEKKDELGHKLLNNIASRVSRKDTDKKALARSDLGNRADDNIENTNLTDEHGKLYHTGMNAGALNIEEEISDFITAYDIEIERDVILKASDGGTEAGYNTDVFNTLTSLSVGEFSDVLIDRRSGYYIIGFCKAVDADLSDVDSDELANLSANISSMITKGNSQAIAEEFFEYLRSKYDIKTNESIIFREINF